MQTRRDFLSGTVATALASGVVLSPGLVRAEEYAVKMFEKTEHDFGVVARGADAVYRLKLKNIFQQPFHISEVRTTCGCSAGKPSQDTLQSLEEAYIEITMDTRKFMRRKDSNVIVVFDSPVFEEVRIPITAYIRTDVVVEPGSAQFGSVEKAKTAERTLKIAYAGRDNWTIKEIKTGSEFVTAKAIETARGNGRVDYDLVVTLSEKAPYGGIRQFITLITDDENSPQVPILVEAEVQPDIVVNPPIVAFGTMAPGQRKTVNVVLRGRKPFEVTGVTCAKAKDVFEVRLPQSMAPVQVIPLTMTAPEQLGTLDEELSVSIPGQEEPITFRAFGRIASAGEATSVN